MVAFLECVRDYPSKSHWNSERATEALGSYWSLPGGQRTGLFFQASDRRGGLDDLS